MRQQFSFNEMIRDVDGTKTSIQYSQAQVSRMMPFCWNRPNGNWKAHCAMESLVFLLWVATPIALNYFGHPVENGFMCNDIGVSYPYRPNTVPDNAVVATSILLPLIIMSFSEWLTVKCHTDCNRTELFMPSDPTPSNQVMVVGAYLTYFFGFSVVNVAVCALKLTTGRLRPHFLDVCRPDFAVLTGCPNGYVSEYNCTTSSDHLDRLVNARMSFPSGHASNGVYMAGFLIFYFERRLRWHQFNFMRLTSYAVLITWAGWCSITRVTDNSHFPSDVISGALIGILVAFMVFYRSTVMCLETTSPLSSRQASSIINDQEAHDSTKPAVYNYENGCKQDDVDKATRDVNQTKQTFGHSRCMVMNEESCIHNGLTESPTSPTPLLFLERRAEQRLKQNNANLCSEHSHRQLRGKTLLN